MFSILIVGCSSSHQVEYLNGQNLSWLKAVAFISSKPEKIKNVWQTHALNVNIELENGVILKTKESKIDELFSVLSKCGTPCKHIGWITE